MDKYTTAVVNFLKDHPAVCDLHFTKRDAVASTALHAWETSNCPLRLPDDLKAFLLLSDGFSLRWDVRVGRQKRHALGCMALNGVKAMRALPLDASPEDDRGDGPVVVRGSGAFDSSNATPLAAFDLDASCAYGRVAPVFVSKEVAKAPDATSSSGRETSDAKPRPPVVRKTEAQVWFQDLAARWHPIAGSFSEYFRVMASHLGLPNWQYAFTDIGLDPAAKQWFSLLAPTRLAVDLDRARLKRAKRRPRSGASVGGGKGSGAKPRAPSSARPTMKLTSPMKASETGGSGSGSGSGSGGAAAAAAVARAKAAGGGWAKTSAASARPGSTSGGGAKARVSSTSSAGVGRVARPSSTSEYAKKPPMR